MNNEEFYRLTIGDILKNVSNGDVVEVDSVQRDWRRVGDSIDGEVYKNAAGLPERVTWAIETKPYYYIKRYPNELRWWKVLHDFPEPTYGIELTEAEIDFIDVAVRSFSTKGVVADLLTEKGHNLADAVIRKAQQFKEWAAQDKPLTHTVSTDLTDEQMNALLDFFENVKCGMFDPFAHPTSEALEVGIDELITSLIDMVG